MEYEETKIFDTFKYNGHEVLALQEESTGEWWFYLQSIAKIAGKSSAIFKDGDVKMMPWTMFPEKVNCFVLSVPGVINWIEHSKMSLTERQEFMWWLVFFESEPNSYIQVIEEGE